MPSFAFHSSTSWVTRRSQSTHGSREQAVDPEVMDKSLPDDEDAFETEAASDNSACKRRRPDPKIMRSMWRWAFLMRASVSEVSVQDSEP